MKTIRRIGVDLGGTKIETVVLDEAGREAARQRVATPAGDYDETVRRVVEAVTARAAEIENEGAEARVGVCGPGSVSRETGLMRNANSTCLNGRPLVEDLQTAIAAPLRFANDADCFAVSEATDGAGAGASVVFGVIIGTGVGGGLVRDGVIQTGANGVSGEWGHAAAPRLAMGAESRACWCGRTDCVETWLSGPALGRTYREETGVDLTAAEFVAQGGAAADRILDDYASRLAAGLGMIANIVDPDVFVLGGGLSNLPDLAATVEERLAPHVFSDHVSTKVKRARHGDSSGVRGAAQLWSADGL